MEMTIDENSIAQAHLKQIILEQINIQQKNTKLYNTILRRIAIISIVLLVLIAMVAASLFYTINKPESRINSLTENIQELETKVKIQRIYIDLDKQKLDSVTKSVDSIKSLINNK